MGSKHDDNCMRRRPDHPLVCTCGLTDEDVKHAHDAINQVMAYSQYMVNEPGLRADERARVVREIVGWLRERAAQLREDGFAEVTAGTIEATAQDIAREFGGATTHAD